MKVTLQFYSISGPITASKNFPPYREETVELIACPRVGEYVQPEIDGPMFKVSTVLIRKEEIVITVT